MKRKLMVSVVAVGIAVIGSVHWYMTDRGRWTTEAEYDGLARTVTNNELISASDPGIALRFDPAFHYLGGQKFVLYGVADTEQHFFIRTSDDGQLRSLYWIQFEAYLPDNDYRYNYDDSPERFELEGFDFFVDLEAVQSNPTRKRKRGTDGARVREFLASQAYSIPLNYAYARLVHLTDATHRKELMIIFIDDLEPLGLTGSDLGKDGAAAQRWPDVKKNHLDTIRRTMTLSSKPDGT